MQIYFKNDGRYGQQSVGIPVTVNDMAVGYVCEVNKDHVILNIWDKYITEEQISLNMSTTEQDVYSIGINTIMTGNGR